MGARRGPCLPSLGRCARLGCLRPRPAADQLRRLFLSLPHPPRWRRGGFHGHGGRPGAGQPGPRARQRRHRSERQLEGARRRPRRPRQAGAGRWQLRGDRGRGQCRGAGNLQPRGSSCPAHRPGAHQRQPEHPPDQRWAQPLGREHRPRLHPRRQRDDHVASGNLPVQLPYPRRQRQAPRLRPGAGAGGRPRDPPRRLPGQPHRPSGAPDAVRIGFDGGHQRRRPRARFRLRAPGDGAARRRGRTCEYGVGRPERRAAPGARRARSEPFRRCLGR